MPELNMSNVQEALKTFYLPGLRYQMDEALSPFYSQIEKTSKNIAGTDIELALRYGRQGGIGNRDDNGILPDPNSRKTKRAKWGTKNIFARIVLTDKVIKATKSNQHAFASMLETELEDALTDAKDNFNRQLFGDGTGIMAKITKAGTGVTEIEVSSTRFFAEGQIIDILSSSGVSKVTKREVIIVDDVANKVTLAGTGVTVAIDDIVTIAGNYGMELTGLDAIMKVDSNLYGIDRSVNKWFNPYIKNVNGEISELAIQEAIDKVETRAGEGKSNFLLASKGVRRSYIYLFSSQKRIVNTIDIKGGFKALDYNGLPLVADKYQAPKTLDILSTDNFTLNRLGDWDWLEKDGKVLSRLDGTAMYEASLALYADLGCDFVRAQARLTNITEH